MLTIWHLLWCAQRDYIEQQYDLRFFSSGNVCALQWWSFGQPADIYPSVGMAATNANSIRFRSMFTWCDIQHNVLWPADVRSVGANKFWICHGCRLTSCWRASLQHCQGTADYFGMMSWVETEIYYVWLFRGPDLCNWVCFSRYIWHSLYCTCVCYFLLFHFQFVTCFVSFWLEITALQHYICFWLLLVNVFFFFFLSLVAMVECYNCRVYTICYVLAYCSCLLDCVLMLVEN